MRTPVLLMCLLPVFGHAADIHLSPAGSDVSGTGALAAPYRTLGFVLDPASERVNDGDRLILHAPVGNSVYRETEVRLRRRLTLVAAEGASPRIECPLDIPDGVCIQIDPEASGSVLSGLEIVGGNLYGVFLQTNWDFRDAPTGRGAQNVIIENCKIHDSGRDGIKVTPKSNNLTVRNSEIYNTGRIYPAGTPLEDRNAEGIDNVGGDGMRVVDSFVHDTATSGIYFKGGAADVVIERNRVERTGEGGILVGFDTSPEFFDLGINPGYFEAVRAVVRNNIVRDTDFAGIGLFASRDALVAHNTIINAGRVGHAALYFGVTLQDFDPAAARPANINNRIVNNLVQQPESGGVFDCAAIRFSQDLGGLSGLNGVAGLAGNLYSKSNPCVFRDSRPGSSLDDGGSFAMWSTSLNSENGSLLADVTLTGDGHLLPGSAAIGQAMGMEVVDDFDRQSRSMPLDIGADEFAAGGNNEPGTLVISGAQSGSWFNAARSGEGFVLEIGRASGQRSLIASWYTYAEGRQLWLFGSAPLPDGATSVTVPLVVTRGASFGNAFNASDVVIEPWGNIDLSFSDCATLTVRYARNGGESGNLSLTRILDGIDGLACVR